MHKTSNTQDLLISWDRVAVISQQAERLREEDAGLSEEEAFAQASSDGDGVEVAWAELVKTVERFLQQHNPHGKWLLHLEDAHRAEGAGSAVEAKHAVDLIQKAQVGVDAVFSVYRHGERGLAFCDSGGRAAQTSAGTWHTFTPQH